MMKRRILALFSIFLLSAIGYPEEYQFISPYGSTIDEIKRIGEEKGWRSVAIALRYTALRAYEGDEAYAEEWYYLYRWTRLFAAPERDITTAWIAALEKARLSNPNMASQYPLRNDPLGGRISGGLIKHLLGDLSYSQTFFDLQSPYDNLLEVFSILDTLYQRFPKYYGKYENLALAIALVYDVPPPPGWPHFQVPAAVLPRRMNDVRDSFDYWVRLNESHQSLFDLSRLPAEELKFLVDTPASFAELHWARTAIKENAGDFADVYSSVKYRFDRVARHQYVWSDPDYKLKSILQRGGICVDQAYYAAQAGKSKGIPTLLFRGAGMDGRHAWFGYLGKGNNWDFDAGRYGENRYVTGYAYDPQTWSDISDHELSFLGEGFRDSHYYRQSVLHGNFAAEYLDLNDPESALQAAERALRYEKRNQKAWETLLEATRELSNNDPAEGEKVLRRAALAFKNYPDLEAFYLQRVSHSLAERGEASRARRELDFLATKNKHERSDLSITQAVEKLKRSMESDNLPIQLRTFRVIVIQLGKRGGMDLFDRVVIPFIAYLKNAGHTRDAYRMVLLTKEKMAPPKGSMLAESLDNLVLSLQP